MSEGNKEKPQLSVPRAPVETLVFRSGPTKGHFAAWQELKFIVKDLKATPDRKKIPIVVAFVVFVLLINMVAQVYLNRWTGGFYRSIEKRDLILVGGQLVVFAEIIAVLLSVVVAQTWLHERFKIRLREWISTRMLDRWLEPGRAYRLNMSSDDAVNPDQRIQEDARNFSEMSADLGIGALQATLLLFSFIGVLWGMSEKVYFTWNDTQIHIPGYMVWIAILYAGFGSWLTAKVGRPLIALNEVRYSQEAELRFAVVRVSEAAESVSFYSGEADEKKIILRSLERVLAVMAQVSNALAGLTWITSGYGWLMIVLPVLVALPGFFQGTLDLGGLMMVVGAFNQVSQSLRWVVDNFARIADWRASLHRVVVFRHALDQVDQYDHESEQIRIEPHPDGHLTFDAVKVSLIDGDVVIDEATAHIRPGERVLLGGESGSGKSTLFRALSGLWPWGGGVIRVPPREDMMFLPQRPYMPLGTLAEALAYPNKENKFSSQQMTEALNRVHLEDFPRMLKQNQRWDKLMSLGQQQRLAFARLLLHKPKWVFLDEATSALDDENQDLVMSLFTKELEGSTLMSIAHRPGLAQYHTRTLQLMHGKAGVTLRRRPKQVKPLPLWRRLFTS